MGIEQRILAVPSIALGTPDLSVYEMVGAYGAFANQGIYVKPTMITRIEDKNGDVVVSATKALKIVSSKNVIATITGDASVPGTPVIRKNLDPGIMGEANMDGTIYISDKIVPGSFEERQVLNHEMVLKSH